MFKRESTTRAFSSRGEKGKEGERGKSNMFVCVYVCTSICVLVRIKGGSVEDILEKGYIDPVVRDYWLWHATTKSCFTRPSSFSSRFFGGVSMFFHILYSDLTYFYYLFFLLVFICFLYLSSILFHFFLSL